MLGGVLWAVCCGLAFKQVPTQAKLPVMILHAVLFVFSLICWVSLVPANVNGYSFNLSFNAGHGTLIMANILYAAATALSATVPVDAEANANLTEVTVGSGAVVGAPSSDAKQ